MVRTPSNFTLAVSPCTNAVATGVGPTNDTTARFTVSGTLTIS